MASAGLNKNIFFSARNKPKGAVLRDFSVPATNLVISFRAQSRFLERAEHEEEFPKRQVGR